MTSKHTSRAAAIAAVTAAALGGAALTGTAALASGKQHTTLGIRSFRDHIQKGGQDAITGNLRAGKTDPSGKTVTLEARVDGGKFQALESAVTNAHGNVDFLVKPTATTHYELVFAGDAGDQASHSGVVTVKVVKQRDNRINTTLSIRAANKSVSPGTETTINGRLRGAGHNLRGKDVILQDRAVGTKPWADLATEQTGDHGLVHFAVRPSGDTAYRLVYRGQPNFQPSHSGIVRVYVRDTALTININPGTVDKTYGDNTPNSAVVSGVLTKGGTALADEPVVLKARSANKPKSDFKVVNTGTTGTDGSVSFTVSPNETTRYKLVAAKDDNHGYARSPIGTLYVKAQSLLSIASKSGDNGSTILLGQLKGNGHGLQGRTVKLESRNAGSSDAFTVVKSKKAGKNGYFRFTVKPSTSKDFEFVYTGGWNYYGSTSAVQTVTVV